MFHVGDEKFFGIKLLRICEKENSFKLLDEKNFVENSIEMLLKLRGWTA